MKKWPLLLIAIILATFQLTWPVFLSFFNCKPDLLLILAVTLIFYLDFKAALIFAVFCGLLKDVFLPSSVALNTILFSLWSFLIYRLSSQVSTEDDYMRLAIVLVVSLLNNIVIGLQSINSGNIIPPFIFLRNLIIPSVYTAALSPLVFKLVKRITV